MRSKPRDARAGLAAAILLAALAAPLAIPIPPARAGAQAVIDRNVAVPMRDGAILRADVRRPAREGRFPVLVFRTPYDKGEGDADNERTFAAAVQRGYAVVVEDVRGRFASEGEFNPYWNEGRDGYDTIEWAARQSWSDGRVGTFGLSYPGQVQWLAAVESPPHLLAMVPAMTGSSVEGAIYFGGVFEAAWANWAYRFMSADIRVRKDLPGPRTLEAAYAEWDRLGGATMFQGWLPSQDMPYLKDTSPYYYGWLARPPYDPAWAAGDLRDKYGRVGAAVLNLSGWHDEAYGSGGAVANFLGLSRARAPGSARTRLIVGPWVHGVEATGLAHAGKREFGPAARIDYDAVVLDFLDHYVRGLDTGETGLRPVRVYVMGSDVWIDSDVWPLPDTRPTEYYLAAREQPGAGALQATPAARDVPASFVADPADPVRDEFGTDGGAFDLRSLADRPDVLTFETAPYAADLTVVGHVGAEVYASSDAPDFDLYVKILDVAPDGTAWNLESPGREVLRASYRDATPERRLLTPGEIVRLSFPNLLTGNTFLKGHRLRVCVMASWFPIYSRNLQTGLSETVSATTRKATITLHSGPGRPTRLVLPVIPAR